MKLKSLNVKNYRGLRGDSNKIGFDKSEIIFLVGENNSGKSTFLAAYSFIVNPTQKASIRDFYNQSIDNPIEIEAEFLINPSIDSADKILAKEEPDWISKWANFENIIKIRKIWIKEDEVGKKQTFNPNTNSYQDGGFGGFDSLLKRYAPVAVPINAVITVNDLENSINDIINKNHIKKLETIYTDNYGKVIGELQNLKTAISKSEDISEINRKMNVFFTEIFPKLMLSIYPLPDEGIDITKTLKSTHGVCVHDDECEHLDIDLKQNGHGVVRQAFFSFLSTYGNEISGTEKQYLILFEEPELYLHPEAIFSLRKQLYSLASNSPYQILCATHGPMMIDLEKPHSSIVRLVKDEKDMTRTFQVDFDLFEGQDKDKLQMINRFNPHICESFFAKKVILVEGDTEAVFYRDIISRFYPDEKVFVLNTGSKANIVFFQKILTHFGINHVILHDCDSKTFINRKGEEITNPMYSFNRSISDQIIVSNQQYSNISRRFVHFLDFENAHCYSQDESIGKPLSAYNYAKSITAKITLPCFEFLDDLFGPNAINITEEELEKKYISITIDK